MSRYPGRPREFTHPKRRELIDHIGHGATVEEAARIVGVSLRTVQRAAKHNEFFDHDLHLALHAAPVDPHKLMLRAARTHWRAAAWLLERTDPDRFAKRPPNSCRPETLMDVSAWLIETALEATAPDEREAVYRRMHAVADKAFNVLMPDQHDARRSLVGALPDRPTPLSDHEFKKTLRHLPAVPDFDHSSPPAPTPAPPRPYPREIEGCRLLDSEDMDADWRYELFADQDVDDEEDAPGPAPVVEADSASKINAAKINQARDKVLSSVQDVITARQRADAAMKKLAAVAPPEFAEHNDPLPTFEHEPAPPAAVCASADPPNGGIMSPKMPPATKPAATESAAVGIDATNPDGTSTPIPRTCPDPSTPWLTPAATCAAAVSSAGRRPRTASPTTSRRKSTASSCA